LTGNIGKSLDDRRPRALGRAGTPSFVLGIGERPRALWSGKTNIGVRHQFIGRWSASNSQIGVRKQPIGHRTACSPLPCRWNVFGRGRSELIEWIAFRPIVG
jgi:hypothetical protein